MEISLTLLLSAVFGLALLVQLYYFFRYFSLISFSKPTSDLSYPGPVSIIICAKNEAVNLQKNLPLIFDQDYPDFEIVVVNDCSFDESGDILEEFKRKYNNLHIVTLKEEKIKEHDKKLALTIGIKGAKYSRLLFTDADCIPASRNWLKHMASGFSKKNEIVIGYGSYDRNKGFLNKIIRFDTFMGGVQFLSFAKGGSPYMGVGRNLGYTKDLFFRNKGFAYQYHIKSGDDDLFVNRNISNCLYSVVTHPEGHTISEPKTTLSTWILQKRRHISTAAYYRSTDKMRLGIYQLSLYLFYACFISLLLLRADLGILLAGYFVRFFSHLLVTFKAMEHLNEKELRALTPLLEIVLLFIYPVIYFKNLLNPPPKWK